jgi:hypothetical protein
MSVAAVSRLPPDWIVGLHITPGTDTAHDVDVSAGRVRDEDDSYDIISSGTETAAIDTTGAGGRDASDSLSNNTWYAIYIIARTDTGDTAAFFSTSSTWAGVGTKPTNYDVGRRIGWIRTDGSANIRPFIQSKSSGNARWWWWDSTGWTAALLENGGTATTWTDCSLENAGENWFGPTAVRIQWRVTYVRTGASADTRAETRPKGMTVGLPGWRAEGGLAGASNDSDRSVHAIAITNIGANGRKVQYKRSNTAGTVRAMAVGWEDRI